MDVYVFRKESQAGGQAGKTDAFVNLPQNTPLTIYAPTASSEGGETWLIKGVKFYAVTTEDLRDAKDNDVTSLKSGNLNTYQNIFGASTSEPAGITVTMNNNGASCTVTDSGGSGQCYEYLVWIQQDGDTSANDYVDPGVRNNW
jgi:hypothetical protein